MFTIAMRYCLRVLAVALVLSLAALGSSCARPLLKPPRAELDLQTLLDNAMDDGQVEIPFGEYVLDVGLKIKDKSGLKITAQPGARILVNDVMEDIIALDNCQSARIENLYLRHVKPLDEYECQGACIRADGCGRVTIVNCELNGSGAFGVAASETRDLLVQECFIHHNTYAAIYLYECDGVTVRDNRIVNNAEVLSRLSSDNVLMENNRLK